MGSSIRLTTSSCGPRTPPLFDVLGLRQMVLAPRSKSRVVTRSTEAAASMASLATPAVSPGSAAGPPAKVCTRSPNSSAAGTSRSDRAVAAATTYSANTA